MTTSQTPFLSEILGPEPIPSGKLAYFRRRLSNRIHQLVLAEFMRREQAGMITRAKLARKIGREPAQVTRWLGTSGNWTIDTLSDLSLGMACEPSLSMAPLSDAQTRSAHAENVADKVIIGSFGNGALLKAEARAGSTPNDPTYRWPVNA